VTRDLEEHSRDAEIRETDLTGVEAVESSEDVSEGRRRSETTRDGKDERTRRRGRSSRDRIEDLENKTIG